MTIRSIVAGATAVAVALATAAPVFAKDKHSKWYGGNDRYYYDHGSRGYYDNYGRWRAEDRYGYNRNDRRHHHGDDNGTALGIGLGVVGLALVLGAMNSGKNKNRDGRYEHRDDRYDKNGWYRGDNYRRSDGSWNNPDDDRYGDDRRQDWAYGSGTTSAYSQFNRSDCVQTREYQSRVTVGGRNRDAYGTSCLLGNGQWVQGPPQLVPEGR